MSKIIIKSRGREVNEEDLVEIKAIIARHFLSGRRHISRELSKYWEWYQPNGQLKDMACREILVRLERAGHIKLPPGRHNGNNQRRNKGDTGFLLLLKAKEENQEGKLKEFQPLELKLAESRSDYGLWNNLVKEYHYQGYQGIIGANLKYLCYSKNKLIACLGWGSAAWNTACRDKYIGWDKEIKDNNLHFVANNVRFLIFPWIKIKHLASHLLSLNIKRLNYDWQNKYGHPIYLLETFVEKDRFAGTSYKAANWIYVGETKGYSKKGSSHYRHRNIKDVYLYPLVRDFREKLTVSDNGNAGAGNLI